MKFNRIQYCYSCTNKVLKVLKMYKSIKNVKLCFNRNLLQCSCDSVLVCSNVLACFQCFKLDVDFGETIPMFILIVILERFEPGCENS